MASYRDKTCSRARISLLRRARVHQTQSRCSVAGPWRRQAQQESEDRGVRPSGFHHAALLSHPESQLRAAAAGLQGPLQLLPEQRTLPGVLVQEQHPSGANHQPLPNAEAARHIFNAALLFSRPCRTRTWAGADSTVGSWLQAWPTCPSQDCGMAF